MITNQNLESKHFLDKKTQFSNQCYTKRRRYGFMAEGLSFFNLGVRLGLRFYNLGLSF